MLPVKAIFGTPCFWGFKVHDLYQHLNLWLWLQPRSLRPSQRLQLTQHLFRMKQVQRRFFCAFQNILAGAFLSALLASPGHAIIGGQADPQLAQHAVMILTSRGSFCTATIISPTILLTAGHCVHSSDDLRVHWRDRDNNPVLKEVRSVLVHPEFRPTAVKDRTRSIDLALVRLKEALPQNFMPLAISPNGLEKDQIVDLGGYGLSIENDPKTSGAFRALSLNVIEPYGKSKILLWLQSLRTKGNAGSCTGDSGGPIVNQAGELVAIISWAEGSNGKKCGLLTQGILLQPQMKFIDGAMKQWSR